MAEDVWGMGKADVAGRAGAMRATGPLSIGGSTTPEAGNGFGQHVKSEPRWV